MRILLLILREIEQFNFFPNDYWAQAKSGNDSLQNVREYGQKIPSCLTDLVIKAVGSLGESVKKGKSVKKNLFFRQC